MSRRPLTVGIGVIALTAAVFLLQLTAAVLIPLVVSLLLFYALDPLVQRLVRWRVPRPTAALVVMLAFVGGIGAGGWVLWPQIEQVVVDIPKGAAELRRELRRARGGDKSTLQRVQEAAKAIDAAAAEAASPPPRTPGVTPVEVLQPTRTSEWLWSGGAGAMTFAGQTLTVLFLTVFLLGEGDAFKRKFVRHLQTRVKQRVTVTILNDIERQIQGFLRVTVATSIVVGLATGFILWSLDVRQPAVWGLFAGVMNVVPYFGPLLVTRRPRGGGAAAVRDRGGRGTHRRRRADDHDARRHGAHPAAAQPRRRRSTTSRSSPRSPSGAGRGARRGCCWRCRC